MFFFQLRNELWKLFAKKRTYLGFAMFFLVQSAFILLLRYGRRPHEQLLRSIARAGVPVEQFLSNLTIACATLLMTASLLLPLYAALVGGDLVAKETEDGTLRMILSRPISRLRLLLLKWTSAAIFCLALVTAFACFGALFSRLFFPSGSLFVFNRPGGTFGLFEGTAALERYAIAHLVLVVKACTIMSLAFMLSCFNMKPAAATILAVSLVFISMILQEAPFLRDLQDWFFTHHLNVWNNFLQPEIPWSTVGKSLAVLAGYNLAFVATGCTIFERRDIKS